MSLKTFNKVITHAKEVVESAKKKISEDAATVFQGTSSFKNAPTVFVIDAEGVNLNILTEKIKSFANPSSTVTLAGDKIIISTTNPTATTRVLKLLRISATVQGNIINQPSDQVEPVATTDLATI